MKTCTIEGCDRKHIARGMCQHHYDQVRRSTGLTPGPTTEERFWAKVEKTDSCWNWTSWKVHNGKVANDYGVFWDGENGRDVVAHRYSYELHKGPIPDRMEVDHTCFNRACVKPAHLRVVTHKQNNENHAGPTARNKSGVRGVHWDARDRKWRVQVRHNGRTYTSYHAAIEDAEAAAIAKRNELHTHNDLDRVA